MVFQEKTYSVLIVSASDSFINSVMPLLPMTDYWPVSTVDSVGQARRRLADTEFDIVLINTPLPAISDAIYNAIGTRFYELPITPEQIAMAAAENHK